MPLPAVAIVIVGLGAATSLGTTYMVTKQQEKARESNMEMMRMMKEENEMRSAQMMQFLQYQSAMNMQKKQQMAAFLKQTGYGDFAAQCLLMTCQPQGGQYNAGQQMQFPR
ncbi:MAG: hypothetical protein RDV48_12405 [Candidatus Eremiobacteraeota bacterium]|nr:hypothetical protein [Candidatus Eremiobacteraeota bacterium]